MAFVNVKRDVTDQFYRYKMPLLIAKVETHTHTQCALYYIYIYMYVLVMCTGGG